MSSRISGFFASIVKYRLFVMVGSVLLTIIAALPMGKLHFMQSEEMWIPQGDHTLSDYNHLREWFGPSQYLVVGVSSSDPAHPLFNPEVLTATKEITDFLEGHQLVVKVSSITNHQYMESDGHSLWLRKFLAREDYHRKAAELAPLLLKRLHADPLAIPQVVNRKLTDFRISALITYKKDDISHHITIVKDLQNFIASKGYEKRGIKLQFTGFPFIAAKSALNSISDQSILLPILLIILIVLLRVTLGRWAYAALPIAIATATSIMTLGIMGASGFALNSLNASLPLLIIATAVTDAVHLISRHNLLLLRGIDSKEAATATAVTLWRPCLFTSVTTALGFGSLLLSSMQPVREYGIAAAASVLIAYIVSLTTLIAWLSYLRHPAQSTGLLRHLPDFAAKLADFGVHHRKPLAMLSVALLAGGGWMASQLTADANYLHYFRANSPVATGLKYFDQRFGGANNVELAIDSGKEDGMLEPAFLRRAAEFQHALSTLDGVGTAPSLIDYLIDMNRVFTGSATLPVTRAQASQYLFLYASSDPIEDLTDLRSSDNRYLRLSLPIKNRDSSQMETLLRDIEGLLSGRFQDMKVTLGGDLVLQHTTEHYINKGLQQSFSLAAVTILLCLLMLFRSLRYGLVTLIPTVVPLFIAAGLMVLFGVYLEFGTMIVAAIVMGIAVDDAIHIVNDYRASRRNGSDAHEAIGKSLSHTGPAVVGTSIILFCSFGVMAFSSFMPNVYFGIFASVIIVGAFFSTLILTPALLAIIDKAVVPATRRDLVTEN